MYIFILGLTLGSFYNVVGLRVPEGQSIVSPRSSCPNCQRELTWRELIPVFSYVFQKGKCSNCKATISPKYPIFELITGLLFVLSFYLIGFDLELIAALSLVSLLVIITVSDLAYMIIPNKVLAFFIVLFILERIFVPLDPWYDPALAFIVALVLLLLVGIVSKGGMGGGDIKLFAVLGVVLGLEKILLTFFLSALIGAVFGGIGLIIGKSKRGNPIPFGPYIAVGALLSYFFGTEIIHWYFSTFL
ncbi:prepilin peptidase [Salinibacillus xinjiangensis]|uniref:Prepilin peptidase n=1 Tax=Salinibacillus xinjiangensis TaxID=1229268 RepID=A0A6G1X9B5_9BACI|nr:prepilin peptidase [Salinibacillus xinjiangensis]